MTGMAAGSSAATGAMSGRTRTRVTSDAVRPRVPACPSHPWAMRLSSILPLIPSPMKITLPGVPWIDKSRNGNKICHLREGIRQLEGTLTPFTRGRLQGHLFQAHHDNEEILVISDARKVPEDHLRVVQAQITNRDDDIDIRENKWIRHPLLNPPTFRPEDEIPRVLESWLDAFSYTEEDAARAIVGLRRPQIGAVHAANAHWSASDSPATIVMPTGTGKTEVMLSILVSVRCSRVLVIVPTDALRTQLANKFVTLGILKEPGCAVLSLHAKHPIVGILKRIPKSIADVDTLFGSCHVVVTTSSIAGRSSNDIQRRIAAHCPYLFIDEAHHAEAPTWRAFKERFQNRRIVQFTATPFREDGKPIDGRIIYTYPLKRAQKDGYFGRINFKKVIEFNSKKSDAKIAEVAVNQLRRDLAKGHILMARVETVARAKEVFAIYKRYTEYNPVQLHTGIKSKRRREAVRKQILSGQARIVVCVDMLGEGFDLPELKIAAFHDIRKSFAVTLQLAGRFTRARKDLGDATFIANTADIQVRDELRSLYARDPDWNALLPELSERMIGERMSLQGFLEGFIDPPDEIPVKSVRPAMSTVAYKTHCANWHPERFRAGIPAIDGCALVRHTISEKDHTLIVITARRTSLEWADVEDVSTWQWELHVVIWSPEQALLFINGSSNAGVYRSLAIAIAGRDVTLIDGQQVFRTFAGVNRLRLQNVGLTEQLGRNIRYTGRMGANVESGLTDFQRQRARKTVLSGNGFEDGHRVTVGASRKGRIWSHQRDRVDKLVAWCKKIGNKLMDSAIDPDKILEGTLTATIVTTRPVEMPIAVDWPEKMYKTPEKMWSINIDGVDQSLSDFEMSLVRPDMDGALRLAVASDAERIEVLLELFEEDDRPTYRFRVIGDHDVVIQDGSRRRTLGQFFYFNPPMIWFSDGSSLEGNQHVKLKSEPPLYDPEKILVWEWEGIDIRKESQGIDKHPDSIQARVIRELRDMGYDMIVDDDGKGEAADVVAIRVDGDRKAPRGIDVEFYHCKYSHDAIPGSRIGDLYEVCGQAQRSASWMVSSEKKTDLFTHLMRREAARRDRGVASRYEVGDTDILDTIREMNHVCPVNLKVFIVQPGLAKQRVSRKQRLLLSVTENYLFETYQLPFTVIGSA